ncbi:unnamed protein product [Hermetia illucens]|uniref:UDP-glucose 4-epimerase n=1 Tax=Hermetia illucens TaxID=343691 RepID=A0A7R8UX62_HERIL|nr:unnamed protein product [Hermetia illucens]
MERAQPPTARTIIKMSQTVLVTGGAGYVGSHTIIELLNAGYNVICVDNLCNAFSEKDSLPESLKRVQEITGKTVGFYAVDLKDKAALTAIFKKVSASSPFQIESV